MPEQRENLRRNRRREGKGRERLDLVRSRTEEKRRRSV